LTGSGSEEATKDEGFRTGLTAGQKWTRYVWIGVWLVFLAPLVQGIVRGEYRPTTLATAALVAYCVLYVRTFYLAFGQHEKTRRVGLEISALTLIALSTSIAFGGDWILLFIFLSPALAAALPRRWAVAAVLTVTAVMGAFAMVAQSMGVGETTNLLFGPLFGGLLTVFIKRTKGLIRELRETREELARTAVAEERLRFARDLHDLLGHTLSLVVVKSEAVRRRPPTSRPWVAKLSPRYAKRSPATGDAGSPPSSITHAPRSLTSASKPPSLPPAPPCPRPRIRSSVGPSGRARPTSSGTAGRDAARLPSAVTKERRCWR
jgi:hypothetical protein